MDRLWSCARRAFIGVAAAGLLTVGITTAPASAVPADRAPTDSVYQVERLIADSGAAFLPSDSGNPINSHGWVAGSTTVDGVSRAAVFNLETNQMQVLSAFPGLRTEATDINDPVTRSHQGTPIALPHRPRRQPLLAGPQEPVQVPQRGIGLEQPGAKVVASDGVRHPLILHCAMTRPISTCLD